MGRIAFYLDTRNVRTIDVQDVDAGNPGMGGTEYMFFLIAAKLALRHEVTMYVTALGSFPPGVHYREVNDFSQVASRLEASGEDILILRESEVLPNLSALRALNRKVLVWAHNFSGHRTLKACVRCPSIVRYLCVSREQYENLRDEDIFTKADFVYNAVVTRSWPLDPKPANEDTVFYMGSLIEAKGFHVLARQWPEIVKAVPTAHLHVVGSGRLYDRQASLGPLGIASPEYERRFARDITLNGVLRKDITFHGTIGADKLGLLAGAKVAVANPTGVGETFCITALEFGLLGVPVVTKKVGGPINVIENGVSGILYDHEEQLASAVISLLRDEDLRHRMGQAAIHRMRTLFDIEVVLEKWEEILRQVWEGVPASRDYAVTGSRKQLKECNRRLRSCWGLHWLPSIDYWHHAFKKKKHSLFVKPFKRFLSA